VRLPSDYQADSLSQKGKKLAEPENDPVPLFAFVLDLAAGGGRFAAWDMAPLP
jgi:hypothetical protein